MAVCCQNLPLGALSSRSAPSVLVCALFKKFDLFWTRLVRPAVDFPSHYILHVPIYFTWLLAYLHQKDERALPGNLQGSKLCRLRPPVLTSDSLFSLYSVKDLHTLHLQHFVAYAPSIKPGILWPNDKGHSRHSINAQQAGSLHAVCEESHPARGPHESAINSIPPAGASAPPTDLPLTSRTETCLMDVSDWSNSRPHITSGLSSSSLQREIEIAVPCADSSFFGHFKPECRSTFLSKASRVRKDHSLIWSLRFRQLVLLIR